MYRISGDRKWLDKAWTMFEAIEKATRSEYGYTAIDNVNPNDSGKTDQANSCESFWTGETTHARLLKDQRLTER
jgi:hypothetical protein